MRFTRRIQRIALTVGVLLLAALPVFAGVETTAKDPRGALALDALPEGALAGKLKAAPEAGDPRLWYFVVTKGTDPDFEGIGAKLESSWKNRRLVRVPPQAVEGLGKHPNVMYLQLLAEPGTTGHAAAEMSVGSVTESLQSEGEVAVSWTSGDYSYDGAGNVKSIGPDSWGRTQNFAYDGVGRLVSGTAHTKDAAHTESYKFDEYGNLISKTTDGQALSQAVSTSTNRLSAASYDEAGNLIQNGTDQYFYDGGGMMKEMWYGVAGQNAYVYTPHEERIGVMNNGANYWTWTVRDFSGKVIREYESSGDPYATFSPWLWVEDYVHGAGRLLGSEREAAEGGRRHYHTDHLGTTRMATTDDGIPGVTAGDGYRISDHVYFPFGVESTKLPQEHAIGFDRETRAKYTGHERDYTGGELVDNTNYLDYMRARYYNPNLGRFLSVDPAMDLRKTLPNPQMWNRYAYVLNNPLRFTDPTGREHVQEPGFTKPLSEADWSDAPPIVQGAFYAEGALLSLAAGGPLRNAAFEGSLLLMRNPGTVLGAMKLLDSMGGNVSGHINPAGQTGGKLGFLLGNVESEKSIGRGGFFAGVMGFTGKALDGAIRSHFADNFKNGVLQKDGRLAVTGAMTGANGVVAAVKTVWQWNKDKKVWDLITAFPAK